MARYMESSLCSGPCHSWQEDIWNHPCTVVPVIHGKKIYGIIPVQWSMLCKTTDMKTMSQLSLKDHSELSKKTTFVIIINLSYEATFHIWPLSAGTNCISTILRKYWLVLRRICSFVAPRNGNISITRQQNCIFTERDQSIFPFGYFMGALYKRINECIDFHVQHTFIPPPPSPPYIEI